MFLSGVFPRPTVVFVFLFPASLDVEMLDPPFSFFRKKQRIDDKNMFVHRMTCFLYACHPIGHPNFNGIPVNKVRQWALLQESN